MLKNIRLHIEKDETRQAELEAKLATHIAKTSNENLNAFQRHIPSLVDYFHETNPNISLFCNKFGELNVVDYGSGRTLYGLYPEQEIISHVEQFCQHPVYVDFSADHAAQPVQECVGDELASLHNYARLLASPCLPDAPELVIVLGLGLGRHLRYLIEHYAIKHLIIYEPEPQYFKCSLSAESWKEVLEIAKQKGTALYFQIGKDGRDIVANLNELQAHVPVKGAYLYQHYNHPIFNILYRQLLTKSWSELMKQGLSFAQQEKPEEYCPAWLMASTPENWRSLAADDEVLRQNLSAFAQYFPDIYQEFKSYQPMYWWPVRMPDGDVNLVERHRLVSWYGEHPKQESELSYQGFSNHPHKDGLVLGYHGVKLKHYLHYKFVAKTQDMLVELEDEQGSLPQTVKSLILFGLGAGYQLERLLQEHQVEKLFLCEPNRDFFYASLFAIDWAAILRQLDDHDGRLYINIGDDGSHLFRDLLKQFYAVGPYILNNTYFYQSYHNGALNHAIAQLREQLQVVISMGEYFDHAYYGIAHTQEGFARGYPQLRKQTPALLSAGHKEVPVFLVGNGPSLDFSIDAIKEWREQAIVVSCGTSLQVLHRHGIVPDFHAEIEQNRATFDWASRINDFDYLKQITLLSCNGIHPDTAALYKNVYLAFKEGESSTVSSLQALDEAQFEVLRFSFPTVTNFALNLFTRLGMHQLYLLGVDLGFVDNKHHHSKHSGYYRDGKDELYEYAKLHNTALVVPGNFRSSVFTKYEFKVSKVMLEQMLAGTKIDCYNCADGAAIVGSRPLKIEDLLIITSKSDKQSALNAILSSAFVSSDGFAKRYAEKYSQQTLLKELKVFRQLSSQDITTIGEAEGVIEQQKKLLFLSYQQGTSLLFYFLYGTVNYANSVLTKVLYASTDESKVIEGFNRVLFEWRNSLQQVEEILSHEEMNFDLSTSHAEQRGVFQIRRNNSGKVFTLRTNSHRCIETVEHVNQIYSWSIKKQIQNFSTPYDEAEGDIVVVWENTELPTFFDFGKINSLSKNKHFVIFIGNEGQLSDIDYIPENVTFLYLTGDYRKEGVSPQANDPHRYMLFNGYFDIFKDCRFIAAKLICETGHPVQLSEAAKRLVSSLYAYDFVDSVCFYSKPQSIQKLIVNSGNRGAYLGLGWSRDNLASREEERGLIAEKKTRVSEHFPYLVGEDSLYV
ncbi:6-hydroxymethylpterin diphosphokinase MptE-like protein [Bowmanella yangjiangensis]|uniref:Motility associated factor glycosyltransferase family protein n=1 Tax=Bowmanella yangjiangensis TaxID=2811230 RepID=A0ABS3CP29_9ALTE|nr:6-hydroxymethylpterin diphosphokinase MptE-like protein [Bowmanella yangjiangensis]MBN7818854.1 motility associated factor glycosyltransferase family protein [Bowmanella yangjiangensis]